MRKLFTLLILGTLCAVAARADVVVTGYVADAKTREAIDFATVQIMKGDKMVAGTTTAKKATSAWKPLPARMNCALRT